MQPGAAAGCGQVFDDTVGKGGSLVFLRVHDPDQGFPSRQVKSAILPGGFIPVRGVHDRAAGQADRPLALAVDDTVLHQDFLVRVPVRGVAAEQEARAIGVMKKAIAHGHVVAVALEVEGLSVSTAQADGDVSPLTVFKDPVFAAKEHRAGDAIEGTKFTAYVVGDTISDRTGVYSANSQLPLQTFFKKTVFKGHVLEVVDEGRRLVEVVRAVGPDSRCEPPKHAVFDRDVFEYNPLVPLKGEKADAEADLAPGVVLVVLVEQ